MDVRRNTDKSDSVSNFHGTIVPIIALFCKLLHGRT